MTTTQTTRTTFGRAWMADTSNKRPRTYRESLGPNIMHEIRVEHADDGTATVGGSLPGQMLSRITLHDPQITTSKDSIVVRDDRYVVVLAEFHDDLVAAVAELGVAEFD